MSSEKLPARYSAKFCEIVARRPSTVAEARYFNEPLSIPPKLWSSAESRRMDHSVHFLGVAPQFWLLSIHTQMITLCREYPVPTPPFIVTVTRSKDV